MAAGGISIFQMSKRWHESQRLLSCLWLSRMTSVRLTIAQQYKRHLFQKEDQKAPKQKMTWFPADIQKGTMMSDRVRALKPLLFIRIPSFTALSLPCNDKSNGFQAVSYMYAHTHTSCVYVSSLWSSRRSWCCSSGCCCLSWPVMLTACLNAAKNRLAPVDSTCCCAAPAASPWRGRWPPTQPLASSLWVSAKKTRSASRADSTSFSTGPGTRRPESWRWARGLRRQLESRSWTGGPAQHPCPGNSYLVM